MEYLEFKKFKVVKNPSLGLYSQFLIRRHVPNLSASYEDTCTKRAPLAIMLLLHH